VEAAAWACDPVFPFYRVGLVLPARRPGHCYVAAAWARRPEEELAGYDFGVEGHPLEPALRDGIPVVRVDPQGDHADAVLAGLFQGEDKAEELGVPLELGGRRGVLVFASRDKGSFPEVAVHFAADVARLVGLWARPWAGPDAPEVLKEQYETLLEGALDGIAVLVQGRVAYSNASFREIFGSRGAQPGRFADLLTRESAEAFGQAVESLRRRPRVLPRLEVEAPAASGRLLHLELGLQRVLYHGEPASLLQVHNATERTEREQEARDSHLRVDALLQTLASDLREPLTTILGEWDPAPNRGDFACPSWQAEAPKGIGHARARLRDLVNGLVEYSVLGGGAIPWGEVVLAELLTEVERELEGLVRRCGGRIEFRDLPRAVYGRSAGIAAVFIHLMENGLRYARPGVPPVVRLSGLGEEGDFRVFCVEDNGRGVDPELAGEIFELLRRGEGGGAGVGLAIVRRVVHAHGGRVWAETTPGLGSRFYVTLPRPPSGLP
jgi:PAS domain S-box-containing protein